jgi:hypothetical protein
MCKRCFSLDWTGAGQSAALVLPHTHTMKIIFREEKKEANVPRSQGHNKQEKNLIRACARSEKNDQIDHQYITTSQRKFKETSL